MDPTTGTVGQNLTLFLLITIIIIIIRLIDEVDEVLGEREYVTLDDIAKLEYMDKVSPCMILELLDKHNYIFCKSYTYSQVSSIFHAAGI